MGCFFFGGKGQRDSICDYGLQRHFQKSPSLLDPPGAPALFCFISFGVFNVTQRGIMEKGTLKASLPPAGQQDRALLVGRGPNPCRWSAAQRRHLQQRGVKSKITANNLLTFFVCKTQLTQAFSLSLFFCTAYLPLKAKCIRFQNTYVCF